MSEKLVEGAALGFREGGRWLVRDVDLSVRPGEIVTLIGPNGSGKSTTVRLAAGVLKPTEGRIHRRPGLRIGYLPQRMAVAGVLPLTVARLMRLTVRAGDAAIERALARVGVDHLAGVETSRLSGGELQRALLARAIVGEPELLVLDEPVQGVDFSGEAAIYDLIRLVRDETGCGVMLVSHDLHMVMAATDTVICLNGHVCCAGPPLSVAKNPEYLRLFGARASEALAVYRHSHDHTHLPDGRIRRSGEPGHAGEGHAGEEHMGDG